MFSSTLLPPPQEEHTASSGPMSRCLLQGSGPAVGPIGASNNLVSAKQLGVSQWNSAPDLELIVFDQSLPFANRVQRPRLELFPEGIADGSGVFFYLPVDEFGSPTNSKTA